MSRLFATFFGIGLLPWAPGTWGSAAAIPVAWVLHWLGGFPLLAAATVAVALLGWWATDVTTRGSVDHDPSEIVIDEVAGIWLALWPLSAGLWHAGAEPWVFPWPGWVDRRNDALGVMLDDVIAGVMAALCVGFAAFLSHGMLGL